MTATKSLVFLCNGIEIREQEFSIVKDGEVLPVEPRAFRVLLYLLRNPQRLITKDELLQSVWGDVVVTENSLARAILKLRQCLGDDARSPQYIETVSRIGYRLLGSVEIREAPEGSIAGQQALEAVQRGNEFAPLLPQKRRRWRHGRWLAIFGAIAIVWAAGWWVRRREKVHWAQATATPEIARLTEGGEYPKAAALALRAHAVLPDDVTIRDLWVRATGEVSLNSDPAGAEVLYRPYHGDPGAWTVLGQTPISKVRVPQDFYVWRLTKPGFATETFISRTPPTLLVGDVWDFDVRLTLHPQNQIPPEMVPVGGGWSGMTYPLLGSPYVKVDDS